MRYGRAVLVLVAIASGACAAGWSGGLNLSARHLANTERFVVDDVAPGGAADRAGIHTGDELLAIDGVILAGRSDEEVARLGQGAVGTRVRVRVRRGEDEPRELMVERAPRR